MPKTKKNEEDLLSGMLGCKVKKETQEKFERKAISEKLSPSEKLRKMIEEEVL